MRIYDRYILREILRIFGLAVFGFLVVMLGNHLFFELIDFIVEKRVALPVILKIMMLRLPPLAVISFPLGVLFSVILVLSKLSMDKEIDACQTHGMSFWRLVRPAIIFGVIMAAVTFITNEKIVPWTNHTSQNILRRYMASQILSFVEEDVFFEGPEDHYYYVDRVDVGARRLEGVLVYQANPGKFPRVITAREGKWVGNIWLLNDGRIWDFDKKGFVKAHGRFETMELNVETGVEQVGISSKQPQEMSSAEFQRELKFHEEAKAREIEAVLEEIERKAETITDSGKNVQNRLAALEKEREQNILEINNRHSLEPARLTDYYFKFSIPVACLLFSIIAVPLSIGFIEQASCVFSCRNVLGILGFPFLILIARSLRGWGLISPIITVWAIGVLLIVFCGILTAQLVSWLGPKLLSIGAQGRAAPYSGVFYSVLMVAFYYILMALSRELGHQGAIAIPPINIKFIFIKMPAFNMPPALAAWSQNIFFFAVCGALILKVRK